jgi:hypothetical protein
MGILVYDPTAPVTKLDERAISALDSLAGKVVGFIDNAKPNFNLLVDDLAELLTQRYGVRAVLVRGKRGPSVPAPDPIIEEVATQCDLVITGSGD